MKLSNETLTVLKNFSTINEGLEFKQGKKIKTVSASKSVMAEAHIPDEFPETFCVYDLNQFLSVNSTFKNKAELTFTDANIIFKDGDEKTVYRKCADTMIVKAPDRDITLSSVDVAFTLPEAKYNSLMDSAKILSSPNIAVSSDEDGNVELITFDAQNDAQHEKHIKIDTKISTGKYKIVFNTENFKMIPGSYDVEISFKGVAHFKNTKDDIQYWVAFEAKHTKIG